jgi:carbamoylphosphate synthase large subunit
MQTLLLTCAGAQHGLPLVRRLTRIAELQTVLVNADPLCPLGIDSLGCPFHLVPLATEREPYLSAIRSLCARYAVSMILPLMPFDISVLEEERAAFARAGVHLLVPGLAASAILSSKRATMRWLETLGVAVPETAPIAEVEEFPMPAVVKPDRGGFGGRSVFRLEHSWELDYYRRRYPLAVIQRQIQGIEVSADGALDPLGRYLGCVVRRRIAVLAGVAVRSEILRHQAIEEQMELVGSALAKLGMTGFFGMQFIVDAENQPCCFEINGRIMGTHPHSLAAGLDVLPHMVACLGSTAPQVPSYRVDTELLMARQWSELFVDRAELASRHDR